MANNQTYLNKYVSARILLKHRKDVHYMTNQGWDRKAIALLEKRGFAFNRLDINDSGYDLLKYAIADANTPVVKYLVDIRGGDLKHDFDWSIYYLSQNGNVELLKYFISKNVLMQKDFDKLLENIVKRNDFGTAEHKDFVEILLAHGANINQLKSEDQKVIKNLLSFNN